MVRAGQWFGDEVLPTIPRHRDNDIFLLRLPLYTAPTHHTHTMAPKRSNQPGAISQMYTSLASPDNRSVVTAVAFFAVSDPSATSIPATTRDTV